MVQTRASRKAAEVLPSVVLQNGHIEEEVGERHFDPTYRATPEKMNEEEQTLNNDRRPPITFRTARAIVDISAPKGLSFAKGDIITDLKPATTAKTWLGVHKKTGNRGHILENNIEFFVDEDPSNEKEIADGLPSDGSPTKRTGFEGARSSGNKTDIKGYKNVIDTTTFKTCVVALIAIFLYYVYIFSGTNASPYLNLAELKQLFTEQESILWETLKVVQLPNKNEHSHTFLFVHNDENTVECLIKKIAGNCVVYRAKDLSFEESFVNEMKNKLEKEKCMVMYDLENLKPISVKILKGLCDAYNPFVYDSQFFFALNAGDKFSSHSIDKAAREILESLWSKNNTHDDFGGTMTRLTQHVFRVHQENKLPCK